MSKRVVKTVIDATQKTLDEWRQTIKKAMQIKEEELKTYEEKKRELIPELVEAHEKGVSIRELAKIMGINHTTIANWIRQPKKCNGQEKQQDAERPP
jgi:transposase-like protein